MAIGTNSTVLNAVASLIRSVSTAKTSPTDGDQGRGDQDPDQLLVMARRVCAGR